MPSLPKNAVSLLVSNIGLHNTIRIYKNTPTHRCDVQVKAKVKTV